MSGKYNCHCNPKENTKIETCESAPLRHTSSQHSARFSGLHCLRGPLFFFNSLFSHPFLLPSAIHFCCDQCPGKLVLPVPLFPRVGKSQSGRSVTRRLEELVCSWNGESICVSHKCPPEGIHSRKGSKKINGHNDGTYGYQPASFSSSPVFVQWNHENGGHNSYAWALQYRFSFTRAGLAPDGCPTAETNPGFYLQDGERGGVELDTFQ